MTMFSELSIVHGDIFILSCVATAMKSCCSSLMSHLKSIACFWTKSAKSPIQYLSPRPRAQNKHAFLQPHQTKKFSNTSLSKTEFKQHRYPYPSRSPTQCLTVSFGNRQPKRKKKKKKSSGLQLVHRHIFLPLSFPTSKAGKLNWGTHLKG